MTDPLIDAYEECLKALEAGAELEAVLARDPALSGDLRPLLKVALTIRAMGRSVVVPAEVELTNRGKFITLGASRRSAKAVPVFARRPLTWRPAFAALTVVVGIFLGTYGIVAASSQSLPGETLYGVKRSVEQARLWLAPDPTQRAELETEFEDLRTGEVQAVFEQGWAVEVEFTGRINEMAGNRWTVDQVTVVIVPGAQVEGRPTIGARAEIHGTSQPDRTVLALEVHVETEGEAEGDDPTAPPAFSATTEVDSTGAPDAASPTEDDGNDDDVPTATPTANHPSVSASDTPTPSAVPTAAQTEELEFEGFIESITGNVWRIAGRDVMVSAATEIEGNPRVGHYVKVEAMRGAGGALLARKIGAEDQPDSTQPPTPSGPPQPGATPRPTEAREPTEKPEPTEHTETPRP